MTDLERIFSVEAERRGVSMDDVRGRGHSAPAVEVRSLGAMEANLAGISRGEIAAFLRRDPTTVSHYVKRGLWLRRNKAQAVEKSGQRWEHELADLQLRMADMMRRLEALERR